MTSASSGFSAPVKIVFRLVLTIGLTWLLAAKLPQYFALTGGIVAVIILGSILTVLNIIVRPILHVLTAPIRFIAGIIAWILMNLVFLWLVDKMVAAFDPKIITFAVTGGVTGWVVIVLILGIGNWLMKELVQL